MTDQTGNQGYIYPQFIPMNEIPASSSAERQDNQAFGSMPIGQALVPIQTTNGIVYVPVYNQGASNQIPYNIAYAPAGFNQVPVPQSQSGNGFRAGIGKICDPKKLEDVKKFFVSMDEVKRYEFILKTVSIVTVIIGVLSIFRFSGISVFINLINFLVAIKGISAIKKQNLKDFKRYLIFEFAVFITNLNSISRFHRMSGIIFCVLLSLVSGYFVKKGYWLKKNVFKTVWKVKDLGQSDPETPLTKC